VGAFAGVLGQVAGGQDLLAQFGQGVGAALGAGALVGVAAKGAQAAGSRGVQGADGGEQDVACFAVEPAVDREHAVEGGVQVQLAGLVLLGLCHGFGLRVQGVGPGLGGAVGGFGVGQDRDGEQVVLGGPSLRRSRSARARPVPV